MSPQLQQQKNLTTKLIETMKKNIESFTMEENLKSMYIAKHGTTTTMLGNIQNIVNLLKCHADDKEELERLINELRDDIFDIVDNHTKEYHIFSMLYHNTKV